MKWFGESWGAPVNESAEHTETPIGWICGVCHEPVGEEDRGFILPYISDEDDLDEMALHYQCFLLDLGILMALQEDQQTRD